MIDSPVACYDFSSLNISKDGNYSLSEIKDVLKDQSRITPKIIKNIIDNCLDTQKHFTFYKTKK